MKHANRVIHFIEDALLVSLLIAMILLSSGEIVLRNLFDHGIIWIDPLLRVLVLWAGLIGATVASRDNKHIRIDLLSRLFNKRLHLFIQVFVGLFTAFICGVIAWHGARWVLQDFNDKLSAFQGLPSWALEIIIPIAFGLIAIRYLLHSLCWFGMFLRYDDKPGKCSL